MQGRPSISGKQERWINAQATIFVAAGQQGSHTGFSSHPVSVAQSVSSCLLPRDTSPMNLHPSPISALLSGDHRLRRDTHVLKVQKSGLETTPFLTDRKEEEWNQDGERRRFQLKLEGLFVSVRYV